MCYCLDTDSKETFINLCKGEYYFSVLQSIRVVLLNPENSMHLSEKLWFIQERQKKPRLFCCPNQAVCCPLDVLEHPRHLHTAADMTEDLTETMLLQSWGWRESWSISYISCCLRLGSRMSSIFFFHVPLEFANVFWPFFLFAVLLLLPQ